MLCAVTPIPKDSKPMPPRRNNPYKCAPVVLSEEIYSKIKNDAQQWENINFQQFEPAVVYDMNMLVSLCSGNERSLRATDAFLANESNMTLVKMFNNFVSVSVPREALDKEAVRMWTRNELLAGKDSLVALTFGQLPLTGLTDSALFALINGLVPGAAVFVTAAAHPKMRGHGLRFVLVHEDSVERVKEMMHHRLLFAADSVRVLSQWAATYSGFKQLAVPLAVRDQYLTDAVEASAYGGDKQSKLTGGAWPVTVQHCRKQLADLAEFAEA